MTAVIRGKDFWTPRKLLFAGASPGRRPGRLAGGHIADRVDLRKAIALCESCVGKFDNERVDYVTKPNLPFVRGSCDGCGQYSPRSHLFVHHSLTQTY